MSWKSTFSAAVILAVSASIAAAQPSISVSGVENGGNIDWTVAFTPGSPDSSLGIELALETAAQIVGAPTVITPNFQENIEGTDIINPGNDPFAGAITEGVTFYDDTTSVVTGGPGGTVDGFFAALGSTDFGTGGPFTFPEAALTFSTVGTSAEVFWDILIEQGGGAGSGGFTVDENGSEAVGGGLCGDSNGDGVVNTLDIDPFVQALTDPAGYMAAFPGVDFLGANDINMDGSVNTLDIDPFVAKLTGSGAVATPEPAMATLALGLLAVVSGLRRRV